MLIDKLDDNVNKYNNKYQSTIKMNPVETLVKKLMIKALNLKFAILLEYQNIKNIFTKGYLQIGLKKLLWLRKLRTLWRGHVLIVTLKTKKLLERSTKKSCRQQI